MCGRWPAFLGFCLFWQPAKIVVIHLWYCTYWQIKVMMMLMVIWNDLPNQQCLLYHCSHHLPSTRNVFWFSNIFLTFRADNLTFH